MSSTYGENLKLSIFGQSHGRAIGMTLDGIPAGLPVDTGRLEAFLRRRSPGNSTVVTTRTEKDIPEILSGIIDGYTCGAPIAAVIRNTDAQPGDYSGLKNCPRPGHADYTAHVKYKGYQDPSGGGHFSGRLTAPLCIAGGMCMQWLEARGIQIRAHIQHIAGIEDDRIDPTIATPAIVHDKFPVMNMAAGNRILRAIADAKISGDSLGGVIECVITGLPAGLGNPMFGGMESRIAQIVYGIPAVKGVEFGLGFGSSLLKGSENNDPFSVVDGKVVTGTNHCGGILGGITTGMPLVFRVAMKPTPSIAIPQQTVSLEDLSHQTIAIGGRHDPCIVPRAVPVVEAAAAIAVFDAILA